MTPLGHLRAKKSPEQCSLLPRLIMILEFIPTVVQLPLLRR